MTDVLVGPILTMLIVIWGFSVVIGRTLGLTSRVGLARNYGRGGTSFLGHFLLALLFSVLLPPTAGLLSLAWRLYRRAFVVFTEFLTGVHDWCTYRTSIFKYGGAFFAFLAYNGLLSVILCLLATQTLGYGFSTGAWVAMVGGTIGCGAVARTLMRRMP